METLTFGGTVDRGERLDGGGSGGSGGGGCAEK